jgi:hypothetical protein
MLEELADLGMALARAVTQQALAQAGAERAPSESAAEATPWGGGGLVLAFSRINRAVRQTVALKARLVDDRKARAVAAEKERRHQKKMTVKRAVQRVIRRENRGPFIVRDWLIDLNDRLEDLDDTDFGDRPVVDIVAGICRALGIDFDPSRWEMETAASGRADAVEEAEATPPDRSSGADWPAPAKAKRWMERRPRRSAATGSDPP